MLCTWTHGHALHMDTRACFAPGHSLHTDCFAQQSWRQRQRQRSWTQVTTTRRWPGVPGGAPPPPGNYNSRRSRPSRLEALVPSVESRRDTQLGAPGSKRHGAPGRWRLLPGRRGYVRVAAPCGRGAALQGLRSSGSGKRARTAGAGFGRLRRCIWWHWLCDRWCALCLCRQGRFGGPWLGGLVLKGGHFGDSLLSDTGFLCPTPVPHQRVTVLVTIMTRQ